MKKLPIIAPSLLAADFKHLDCEIKTLLDHQIDFLHFDVMDGHFVPNLSFGIPLLESLKPHYRFTYDVHLMISNPVKMTPKFIAAGANIITFHYEAIRNKKSIHKLIEKIHSLGAKAGISVKPKTPIDVLSPYLSNLDLVLVMSVEPGFGGQSFMPDSLAKIAWLKTQKDNHHYDYLIEVDGGINDETGRLVREAGAEVLVAGSYLFGKADIGQRIRGLQGE